MKTVTPTKPNNRSPITPATIRKVSSSPTMNVLHDKIDRKYRYTPRNISFLQSNP
ncbi:hypothetical protein QJS10_CPB13g01157 [Acorus calamus]|uniref:Uncharacterized protein n=1 Tax=Acorus calamus TaxID=4465 RepID=A0AAV9DHG8_ACOCL|nr:hypothetical protein QJS10_CPB13g01157 [Acorus calamus]